jgi:hypothetical protein
MSSRSSEKPETKTTRRGPSSLLADSESEAAQSSGYAGADLAGRDQRTDRLIWRGSYLLAVAHLVQP